MVMIANEMAVPTNGFAAALSATKDNQSLPKSDPIEKTHNTVE